MRDRESQHIRADSRGGIVPVGDNCLRGRVAAGFIVDAF